MVVRHGDEVDNATVTQRGERRRHRAEVVALRLRRAAAGDGRLEVHRREVGRPQHGGDRPERGSRVAQQPRGPPHEVHVAAERKRDAARDGTALSLGQADLQVCPLGRRRGDCRRSRRRGAGGRQP